MQALPLRSVRLADPQSALVNARRYFRDPEWVQVPGCGHWVHNEAPVQFEDIVARVVEGAGLPR